MHDELLALFELKQESLTEDEIINAERILNQKETNSYKKLKTFLQAK